MSTWEQLCEEVEIDNTLAAWARQDHVAAAIRRLYWCGVLMGLSAAMVLGALVAGVALLLGVLP